MGLFDRLFGKKEETEKVLPSSEEVTESTEVEETVKEEPPATLNDKEEQKIADMEAYYQELKARIAATHQPVSTVAQEEPAEEPLVEEIGTSVTPEVHIASVCVRNKFTCASNKVRLNEEVSA